MEKIIIKGGSTLEGAVYINGSKNAAQKIIPAAIVFPGEYIIRNVPRIQDSQALINILKFLGAKVKFLDNVTLKISTETVRSQEIPPEITAESTGSFLFAGALLSRFGSVKIWHPGGDQIGRRRVTWHLDVFRSLGANVIEEKNYYEIYSNKLTSTKFKFNRRTVNGTVNAILASVCASGVTLLENAAIEPDIDNFISFMRKAGAKLELVKNQLIKVEGVRNGFGYAEIDIIPDRNEAATFLIAGVLGKGPVTLIGVHSEELIPLINLLSHSGVNFKKGVINQYQSLTIQCDKLIASELKIQSGHYPGFSTDWGPMIQVLMTQIPGRHIFHETIFSQRFAHIKHLVNMGASVEFFNPDIDDRVYNFLRDPSARLYHAIRISGPTKLKGASVHANDVRAGAALVLAGLIAKGITEISGVNQIYRGYEMFIEKFAQLGASIQKIIKK